VLTFHNPGFKNDSFVVMVSEDHYMFYFIKEDVKLPDNPQETETAMVDGQGPESSKATDSLSFHILMYSLADRMIIKGLKYLSRRKVEPEMTQRLERDSFPQAVFEIYNSTPLSDRGLRDLTVKITMDHLPTLRKEQDGVPAVFEDGLLESVPQFAYDLLLAMIRQLTPLAIVLHFNLFSSCLENRNNDCTQPTVL
jgi:hypothetical protein